MKDIRLIVASHKKYEMPKDDMYIPLYVGSKGKESIGFERDDNGINISEKNPFFCELTGLYWAWKNLNSDYIGICHYRRHFTLSRRIPKSEKEKFEILLSKEEADKILENTDIILSKERKYYIENLYIIIHPLVFLQILLLVHHILGKLLVAHLLLLHNHKLYISIFSYIFLLSHLNFK